MRRASSSPFPGQISLFIGAGFLASLLGVSGIPTPRQQKASPVVAETVAQRQEQKSLLQASNASDRHREALESVVQAPAVASHALDDKRERTAPTEATPPARNGSERPLQLLQQRELSTEEARQQRQFASALQALEVLENMGVADMNYHQMKLMQDLETEVLRSGRRKDAVTGKVYSWREFKREHPFTHSFDVEVMWQELEPVDETAKTARAALMRRE